MAAANPVELTPAANTLSFLQSMYGRFQVLGLSAEAFQQTAYATGVRIGSSMPLATFLEQMEKISGETVAQGLSAVDADTVLDNFLAGGLDSAQQVLSKKVQQIYIRLESLAYEQLFKDAEDADAEALAKTKERLEELSNIIREIREAAVQHHLTPDIISRFEGIVVSLEKDTPVNSQLSAQEQAYNAAHEHALAMEQNRDYIALKKLMAEHDALSALAETQEPGSTEHNETLKALSALSQQIINNPALPRLISETEQVGQRLHAAQQPPESPTPTPGPAPTIEDLASADYVPESFSRLSNMLARARGLRADPTYAGHPFYNEKTGKLEVPEAGKGKGFEPPPVAPSVAAPAA